MPETGRSQLALCAIAKDETFFIREWIAYHYLIGFEKIIVYDNESSPPVKDLVGDFFDAGIVDTVFIGGKGMQLTAYNHCLQQYGPDFEWMAFLDVDEFLVLKSERDVRALLADYEDFSGLAVNMCTFGSSGHLKRPSGLVMEEYRERLDQGVTIKSIVRPDKVKMAFSPHDFVYTEGIAVNSRLQPAVGSYVPACVDVVQINHYSYRSQQDYEEKISRGDAIYVGINPRSHEKFLAQTRKKPYTDLSIAPHVPAVKKMLAGGPFYPYFSVNTQVLSTAPLEQIVQTAGSSVRAGNPELARLIVKLAYRRFSQEKAFLELAHTIFSLCNDTVGMEKAALDMIALDPGLDAYMRLFSALLAGGKSEQAEEIGSFIVTVAGYGGHTRIKEEAILLAQRHGLHFSTV